MPLFRVLIAVAACVLASGCGDLLSLHALFTSQSQVFDPAIEGRWENQDDALLVERSGDRYDVILQSRKDPSDRVKYEVHLVDISGVRFADLLPEEQIGHMFLKVQAAEGRLRMSFFDSEWLRQRVTHEQAEIGGGRTRAVLTLRTAQLRALVAKYARDPRAYDKDEVIFGHPK
jgi:hypothetical protein